MSLLAARSVEVVGVTKAVGGDPEIAQLFIDGGVDVLGDSRLQNLQKMSHLPGQRMLLRLPSISEADAVVTYANISLVSHADTVRALSRAATAAGIDHRVLVMIDMGDMREGVYEKSDLRDLLRLVEKLPGIGLEGIGCNFSCIGGVLPTPDKMRELREIADFVAEELGIALSTISGGNSSSLSLLLNSPSRPVFNQLRIGEAFLTGRETAAGGLLSGAHDDCFVMRIEVLEKYSKPSCPRGMTGNTGLGPPAHFEDRGLRSMAVCAIGQLDIEWGQLYPFDEGIEVVGASSDHLVLDVENSRARCGPGEILAFRLGYSSISRAMVSPYVCRKLVNGV